MSLFRKIKNFFKSNNTNDEVYPEIIDNEIVGTTRGHLIDLKNRIDNLNKANGILMNENKSLKEANDKLKDKIRDLEIKLEKNTGGFCWTSKVYETIGDNNDTDNDLPKQEPIRCSKPKRNRNNRRRNYKKLSSKKDEKILNEFSLIKDKDVPKPGSHDKVEFKNGEPIRRRRKKPIIDG